MVDSSTIPDADKRQATLASPITDTTSTALQAAPGAGKKIMVTSLCVHNMHATVSTEIQILSGATKIYTVPGGAAGGGGAFTFPIELECAENEALNIKPETTGASVRGSFVGYVKDV